MSVDFQRFGRDDYYQSYAPVADLLNRNVQRNNLVMASSEFWFGLDKRENLLDDYRLGYLTGKKADFIVIDKPRYKIWLDNLKDIEPETFRFAETLLRSEYTLIYNDSIYQVYALK